MAVGTSRRSFVTRRESSEDAFARKSLLAATRGALARSLFRWRSYSLSVPNWIAHMPAPLASTALQSPTVQLLPWSGREF